MKLFYSLLATLCFLLILGCGYAPSGYSKDISRIAVPIFDNNTLWRGDEFELTNLVQNEILARLPYYQLVPDPAKADVVLEGAITHLSKPVLVEGELDRTIQSQIVLTLRISLKDQHTGKIIYEGKRSESGEFVGQRAENQDTAKREVYEKLARWVTAVLDSNLKETK